MNIKSFQYWAILAYVVTVAIMITTVIVGVELAFWMLVPSTIMMCIALRFYKSIKDSNYYYR